MKALKFAMQPEEAGDASPTWLRCLAIIGRSHGLNLTVHQLVKDNLLASESVSAQVMITCARAAGLKARLIELDWDNLKQLKKALPAVIKLKTGEAMILSEVSLQHEIPHAILRDPDAEEGASLTIDRARLEEIWTGEIVLIRRDYKLMDEDKPFGWGLVFALFLREKQLLRDLFLGAIALSVLALVPMIFWRILTGSVLTYYAYNTFTVMCIGVTVLYVVEGVFLYLRNYLLQIISARVDTRLSEYIFDKLLDLQIDFFERTMTGKVMHDVRESDKIRKFVNEQGFGTLLDSLVLFIFLPIMLAFSLVLTLIVIGISALMVLFLLFMLPRIRHANGVAIMAEVSKGNFLYQNLAGIRTVKSLALESRQRATWDVLTVRSNDALFHIGHITGLIQAVMRPMSQFATSGAIGVGVYMAMSNANPLSVGDLFAFLILAMRTQSPLLQIANLITQFDEANSAVRIVSHLTLQPKEEGRAGHGVRSPLKGHVEFSRVRFKYAGALGYALDDLNFEVPTGWTLGIVGRSGSGKTTVTRLLQRLHSDYEGLIKIDGVDVREYDVSHLRRNLGVVLQENFLFSGSIRENITAAKPHATFEEMVRAARLAGAEEFIDRLPRGYETYIYEGSPNLSGGQRQRLAIARALILDPRILILDEATSALDPDSEAIVNDNIRRIAQGRTVIVISHRLSSLVRSDAILVLERGKFEDIGTHEDLLERCEIYRTLWLQQNRHTSGTASGGSAARGLPRGPRSVS